MFGKFFFNDWILKTIYNRILKKPCPSLQKSTFRPSSSSGNLRFDAYKFSTFRNIGNFHLFLIILLHLLQHSHSLCTFTHHSLILSLSTFSSFLHSINATCLLPYRYYLIYVRGFLSKNRCLENFSSTIEYWRPSTTEYWKNHVPLFKKALSGLLALRETFVLMLTNFRLSETLGTSIYFLLFYFIYCNILILYAHLLITHSSFHFQHSLPSCIQSMQHVYFHIDTTLYMYADFCRKIDVWKIFLQRLNIEDHLQQNTEKTMSLSSKKHFPAF